MCSARNRIDRRPCRREAVHSTLCGVHHYHKQRELAGKPFRLAPVEISEALFNGVQHVVFGSTFGQCLLEPRFEVWRWRFAVGSAPGCSDVFPFLNDMFVRFPALVRFGFRVGHCCREFSDCFCTLPF